MCTLYKICLRTYLCTSSKEILLFIPMIFLNEHTAGFEMSTYVNNTLMLPDIFILRKLEILLFSIHSNVIPCLVQ